MQRLTTKSIIDECKSLLNQYNTMCLSFLGSPGKRGVQRKVDFQILVSKIKNQTPEEAFVLLYQFYRKDNDRSRLLLLLRNLLAYCVHVTIPPLISSRHGGNLSEIQSAIQLFENRANLIYEKYDVNPDESGTILTSICKPPHFQ